MSTFSVYYDLTTKIIFRRRLRSASLPDGGVSQRFRWRSSLLCSGLGLRILSEGYVVSGQSITVKRLLEASKYRSKAFEKRESRLQMI
jgi:hypothetical protein